MAVSIAGTPTVAESNTGATSIAATVPSGAVSGEYLLLAVAHSANTAIPDQTGWTTLEKRGATDISPAVALFHRAATNSEPASYTATGLTSGRLTAIMARITGAHASTPFDVALGTTGTTVGTTTATTATFTDLSTVTAGALVVSAMALNSASNTANLLVPPGTDTIPSATGISPSTSTTATSSGTGRRMTLTYEQRPTAGALGTRQWTKTDTGTTLQFAGARVFYKPASTAPAAPTVNAGADVASTYVNNLFTRTAGETDNGDTITARAWTVVSGPAQVGSTLSTAAALSWTPGTIGTYVLRYSATNSVGTGTDDVSITVAVAVPALVHRIVGVPTTTTGLVAATTLNTSSARLKVGTNSGVTTGVVFGSAATPDAQGGAQLTATGLSAGTQYYYRIAMTPVGGGTEVLDTGTVGSFRTAPSGPTSFAFCFGSCTNATDSTAMSAVAARNDDLFLHLGDLYYADGTGTGVANIREKQNAKIEAANHASVFTTTPTVYTPSDHDAMNNNGTAGSDPTAWTNWNQVFRELWPTPTLPGGSTGCYYTFTWGRVRFIVLDCRSFKSNASATDDSSKTALGTTQKQWFKDTITASPESVIIVAQDAPWIGTASAGDDGWLGYTTERTELATFFAASGKNIALLGGDMHAVAGDDGTNAPGGITVFQAAPMNNNASQKGGPYTTGPYPASGTAIVEQYGRVVVTDSGPQISLAFTGYSSSNVERVTLTETYTVPESATPRYAVTATAISGTWTGTTNATGSTPDTFAVWNTASSGTAVLELAGFAAQTGVPSDATVNSLAVAIRHREIAAVTAVTAQAYTATTPYGSAQALTLSATAHTDTITVTGLTYAQLADLRVRITATR